MAKRIKNIKETHHCEDCEFCRPIKTVPNLDYRGMPFICTCSKQPYERIMRHDYDCKDFKQANPATPDNP